MKHADFAGQNFGKWTVVRWVSNVELGATRGKWLCQCECGSESLIRSSDLTGGKTTRCQQCYWASKLIDLTGQRFGSWTVLRKAERKFNNVHWTCQCECGEIKDVASYQLRKGFTSQCRSCHQIYVSNGIASDTAAHYGYYKRRAKFAGYAFTLEPEDIEAMRGQRCHYCHVLPSESFHGLDRVDSTKGYHKSNVVPCCFICNRAKSDMPVAEFLAWLKRVGEVHGL